MICDRCGQPIQPGEEYDRYGIPGASGAGGTAVLHRELCKRQPRQTYPSASRTPVTGTRRSRR